MKRFLTYYASSFSGLSPNAWVLAGIMLANRAGTMVLPFLGVYLTSSLHFDLQQAGVVLSMFGLGSMLGSLLGGYLTDKFGQFWVQTGSLIVGGSLFLVMANVQSFLGLSIGMLVLSSISECLRPANAASVSVYAKPENVTRAFSLNRMSVNLGFSIGPAIGGILAAVSYQFLFYADGITCISAGLIFYFYFRNKTSRRKSKEEQAVKKEGVPAHRDWPFIAFVLLCLSYAVVLFQLFSSIPLYYREVFTLDEGTIGLLLGLNGLLVFLIEMPLVNWMSGRFSLGGLMMAGTAMNGLSFLLLALFPQYWALWMAMVILSIAEVVAMPFMVTVAVQRAPEGRKGSYLGLYSTGYSIAHILAPLAGTWMIANIGYRPMWVVFFITGLLTATGLYLLMKRYMPEGK